MEEVSIPVSGEKYVWIKNTDTSNGKVVLRKSTLLGVVIPMVIDVGVEEHIKSLSNSSDMFLSPESVEEWGYDIREYSAYTVEDTDKDEDKYVWYTTSASRRYALYKQGHYGISMVMLDNGVDASSLVGDDSYMLSEAEVENSVYDADKFTTVGKNGVRGPKGALGIPPKVNYTRYQLSDKFKEARAKGMVYIPVKTEDEASILRTVINTENGYSDGFDGMLLVYSTRDARFRPLYKYANAKEMSVEEVVELASTSGDSTPTYRPEYRMSEEFDKLHDKDIVAITVANKEQADILTGLLPIDEEYRVGDGEDGPSELLVVYPERTGYGADFNMLEHNIGNPIMPFAKAVVELTPATFSTDGDSGDVISAPYDTTNGIAIDLSDTHIGTAMLPTSGITSAKIMVGYRLTDKFTEALSKGVVVIPVKDAREAGILSTLMEIDPGYKYHSEYEGGALIAVEGMPAMFSPFPKPLLGEQMQLGDAVEGDSTVPYTSF